MNKNLINIQGTDIFSIVVSCTKSHGVSKIIKGHLTPPKKKLCWRLVLHILPRMYN